MNQARFCKRSGIRSLTSYLGWMFTAILLTGCAWQNSQVVPLDAAMDAGAGFKPCSLAQIEARKATARDPEIAGVATPFIIYTVRPSVTDRFVKNGDVIYFATAANGPAAPSGVQWSLQTLDPGGRPASGSARLMDRSLVRLQPVAKTGTPISAANQPSAAAPDAAPPFMIIKADVPDQTRPTTCDGQIRAGDFVFVQSISPSTWLGATPAGGLNVVLEQRSPLDAAKSGISDPSCAQDHESCHTDAGGGFVCAWAPSCAK